ncbi:hypothetical protein O1R50_12490 [Glycomyces luteolus]|uniref:Uncharacterized protein n=1 Tax=Glycomyces luteolus TaxID=2670330 RepID=A0A9X3STN4_9ACTN|nr:hypothetical protein [Glycomyces luteolus]MDA1360448.1 hypothetical protein [Glycomyces luteolus]
MAAVALTATGCSSIPFLDRTEAHELITGATDTAWCANGDGSWFLGNDADIAGPHFGLSILCHFEGTEMPEDAADHATALADLPKLADGTEVLINQIALGPDYAAEFEDDPSKVTAWIDSGDERFDLDAIPAPGDFLALTVPTGDDAVLWIEDDGRAQGLNLRTGEQVEPIMAYYNGLSTDVVQGDSFSAEVTVLNDEKAWDLSCHSDFLEADRSVWREDLGWAAEESVFLQVTFNWCTYEDNLVWHLDPEASLAAKPGSEPLPPLSMSAEELPDTGGTLRYTALFSIPENSEAFPMVLTPVGDLENIAEGDDYAFLDTPAPSERGLVFI